MAQVLVLNSGSSSIKYELIDMTGPTTLAGGLVERIGEAVSRVTHDVGGQRHVVDTSLADHREGLAAMAEAFAATTPIDPAALRAVGHRVVHGGDRFAHPAIIDGDVLAAIRDCIPLAPLHNPANLTGIEVAMQVYPDCPHVAVFDTAFHQSMPPQAFRYALDRDVAGTGGGSGAPWGGRSWRGSPRSHCTWQSRRANGGPATCGVRAGGATPCGRTASLRAADRSGRQGPAVLK